MLAVNSWKEVDYVGQNVEDEDESNNPFEDTGWIVMFLVAQDTEC